MRFAAPRFAPALLALALLAAGCGGVRQAALDPTDPSNVVAAYGGQTLTLGQFERAYAASVNSWDAAADSSLEDYRDFLERYVNFRLKVMEARALGLDRDSALQAEMASYRDQLARPYFLDQQVIDDIVRDLYEKQQEEINAAHILIRVDENAAPEDTAAAYARIVALRDSVTQGHAFADLAFRNSEDPSARQNRGDLGWFTGGRMIHQFEDMAYSLSSGEVSPPVRTRFGYHLIHVKARRPATPEIRASHILIRINGETAADTATALETITQLRDRVRAGEDFATLARQYSDDVASGRRGGDLGFFGIGRMVAPFEEAAFALQNPGDVSDVVETRFGYHLIQLNERKTRPTFTEAYPDLKRLAQQLPLATERQAGLGQRLRAQYGGSFEAAAIGEVLDRFDADSLFLQLRRDGAGPDSALVVATIGEQTFTFGQFLDYFRRTGARPNAGNQRTQLLDLLDAYLNERAIDRALEDLEETDPNFRDLLQQYADGVLLFRISEDSVWTPAAQDEAGLRAYYEAHHGEYRWPERRRVLAFTTPSDSLLTAVAADLDAGRTPREIVELRGDARFALRLDTLYVSDSTDTALDATLGLQPGQHTEVLPERSRLAVYLVEAIEAPREKTFEEARAELVSDYQNVLEAAWVARLRDKYDARTYPERLVGAFEGPRPPDVSPPGGTAAGAVVGTAPGQ